MFSSNQVLKISGRLGNGDLAKALELALHYSDDFECFTRKENPAKCVFQITKDDRYCIGWNIDEKDENWTEYPFDFDINIISQIIEQYLNKCRTNKNELLDWDGAYEKGFLMKAIPETMSDEYENIKAPFHGIVTFSPYTCLYSK